MGGSCRIGRFHAGSLLFWPLTWSDIIHANLLFEAAERHVTDGESYGLAISGAQKVLFIYKKRLGLLAIEMECMK